MMTTISEVFLNFETVVIQKLYSTFFKTKSMILKLEALSLI